MTAAAAPDLRTFLDGVLAGRCPAGRSCTVALELHPALAVLGFFDGVYLVVSGVPAGARLSAGRCNGDFTWSLLPDELDGLQLQLPETHAGECLLTVNIVTPDPLGYDFASTAAQFHVAVKDGSSSIPFNSMRRLEAAPAGGWSSMVQRAQATHVPRRPSTVQPQSQPAAETPGEDVRLAAAKAEWQADEEARMARARAHWEEDSERIWAERATDMIRRHEQDLRDRQACWSEREAERIAGLESSWSARLAAAEVRWRCEEAERIARVLTLQQSQVRAAAWRRAAGWVLLTVAIGSMVLA